MKVALLKGQSQYGVLRLMIDEIACAFQRRGWDVVIADLEAMQGVKVEELGRRLTASGRLDLVFSINIGGDFASSDGRPLIEVTGAPHVLQYVDYPLHDIRRLNATAPSTAVLFVDPSHVQTVNKLLGPDRFAYVGFSPHGAFGAPRQMPAHAEFFVDQRPVPVLFAGTFYRPQTAVWEAYPPHIRKVFLTAIEIATSAEWVSPLDALDHALAAHGINPEGAPGLEREDILGVRMLAGQVQEWVRTERRDTFLRAAARLGLQLTVVGKGYDDVLSSYRNIASLGATSLHDTLRLMQSSRLLINLNGNFGRGSHERPLSAMMMGAAVASDHSSFYAENFEDGQEISLFRWSTLESDLADILDLSHDNCGLYDMAKAGQAKAAANHRWDNRIDTFIAAGKAAAEKWSDFRTSRGSDRREDAALGA